MIASRSKSLNDGLKQMMDEVGVPFLNIYEDYYLSAQGTQSGDVRHYKNELTGRMHH